MRAGIQILAYGSEIILFFWGAGVASHAYACEVSTVVYSQCVIFSGSLIIYVVMTYRTMIKGKQGKLSTG